MLFILKKLNKQISVDFNNRPVIPWPFVQPENGPEKKESGRRYRLICTDATEFSGGFFVRLEKSVDERPALCDGVFN